jgi:hypothetical protein
LSALLLELERGGVCAALIAALIAAISPGPFSFKIHAKSSAGVCVFYIYVPSVLENITILIFPFRNSYG